MKQLEKLIKIRILPAMLAAAMILSATAGCSSAQSGESVPPAAETTPSAAETVLPSSSDELITFDGDELPIESDQIDTLKAGMFFGEDESTDLLVLPTGFMEYSSEMILESEGAVIDQMVASMKDGYPSDPSSSSVTARDWHRYTSDTAKQNLTSSEATFYDRLDKQCQEYISSDTMDGVWYAKYNCYTMAAVEYSDLGLTSKQAGNVYWWFKYNNPQYYFARGSWMYTSRFFYAYMYDFAANAKERANLTNEIFDELDGWIEKVNSSGSSVWQKELAANNLLCKEIFYDYDLVGGKGIEGGQTLYSAVKLGGTVCAGYAAAFSAMMNSMGIDTLVALSPTHAWNVALLDNGTYFAIDVTWNDNKNDDNNPYNSYFNVGENGLFRSADARKAHTYRTDTGPWTPAIPEKDYDPSDKDIGYDAVQLAAPTGLDVYKVEADYICYSWDPVEGVDTYECALFTDESCEQIQGIGPITGEAVAWESLDPSTTYYFGTRATKTDGDKTYYSNWVYISATTAAG